MKKLSFIAILICSIGTFILSCQKEETKKDIYPSSALIKYVINDTNDTTKYTYDSNGRILTNQTNSSNYKSLYTYKGSDSIIISVVYVWGDTDRVGYYELNADGLAIRYDKFYPSQYEYNADGFKTYAYDITYSGSNRDSFFVTNNNVTSAVSNVDGYISDSRIVKTYTLDSRTNTVTNTAIGRDFLGKSNANLITALKIVITEYGPCVPICTSTVEEKNYSYTYEFDSENRVTKMIITDLSNSTTVTTRYVYY